MFNIGLSLAFLGSNIQTGSTVNQNLSFVNPTAPDGNRLISISNNSTSFTVLDGATGLVQVGPAGQGFTGYVIRGGKFVTVLDVPNGTGYTAGIFEQ